MHLRLTILNYTYRQGDDARNGIGLCATAVGGGIRVGADLMCEIWRFVRFSAFSYCMKRELLVDASANTADRKLK
jgi:hypothetical protein